MHHHIQVLPGEFPLGGSRGEGAKEGEGGGRSKRTKVLRMVKEEKIKKPEADRRSNER